MNHQHLIDDLERQYIDRLDERCQKWQIKHPDEAKELRESVTLRFRKPGMAEPEPGSMPWQMVEAAVNEAIRAKMGWPTFRKWLADRPPVSPFNPPLTIVPPAVDRVDHKAKASGE